MNNPLVKLVVVLVVLAGTGIFAWQSFRSLRSESEHKADLDRIRREYLERAPLARQVSEPARYGDEARGLYRWYFDELTDHYNRHAAFKGYERFMEDLTARRKAGKVSQQEFEAYEERYKATWAVWERMRDAKYDPAFTAYSNGLRLDVLGVETLKGNDPKLRVHWVLHGAQRRWTEDSGANTRVRRLTVNASFRELVFKGEDPAGKQLEMRVSGEPFKVDHPERQIDEFPPGIVLGFYDLPKVPADVAKAEITILVATRSLFTGEEMVGTFVWKLDPLPSEWKLPTGAAWEGAQEQVREADPANK